MQSYILTYSRLKKKIALHPPGGGALISESVAPHQGVRNMKSLQSGFTQTCGINFNTGVTSHEGSLLSDVALSDMTL